MTALPYDMPLTNPGAETGTTSGWTQISGGNALPVTTAGGTAPHTGSFVFAGGNVGQTWWGQIAAIPTDLNSAVDAGQLQITATAFHIGFSGDTDSGALCIECLDGSNVWLAGRYLVQSDPTAWTQDSLNMRVPVGTRNIRISTRNLRNAGTELSTYWDDFDLVLDNAADNSLLLDSWNTTTTTGWTQVTGTLQAVTDGGFAFDNILNWSASTTGDAYRTISITDATVQGYIDASLLSATMHCRMSNFDTGGDSGRPYLEFYNGSSTLIGARHYSDVADVNPPVTGQDKTFSVAIPATTRTVRMGITGTRVNGTNLDADFSRISLFATGIPTAVDLGSVANAVGATMAATLTREVDLAPTFALGFASSDILTDINGLQAAPLLGADMAVTPTLEQDLVDNNAVGLTMAASVVATLESDLTVSMALGFSTTASVVEALPGETDALGVAMSVALAFEMSLTPSFSLGLTQTLSPGLATLPAQDIQITWLRRDRLGGSPRFVQDTVPMSEAVEKYDVEILNGGGVVRSFLGLTTNTLVYTAAQQIADGWTYPPIQLSVRVFQLSAVVGRGFGEIIAVDVA